MTTLNKTCREFFDSGIYCAESLLLTFAKELSIESELIPRIATGFCGGMARTGGYCGALTGGIMVLGLIAGRDSEHQSQMTCYECVQSFTDLFEEEFGSTMCPDITGCHIGTEEGRAKFIAENLEETLCAGIVEKTPSLVLQALELNQVELKRPF